MVTRCPHCLTVFEVDDDAVQAEFGIVCCVHCAERFVAATDGAVPADSAATAPVAPESREAAVDLGASLAATPIDTGDDGAWLATVPDAAARALIADAAGVSGEDVGDALAAGTDVAEAPAVEASAAHGADAEDLLAADQRSAAGELPVSAADIPTRGSPETIAGVVCGALAFAEADAPGGGTPTDGVATAGSDAATDPPAAMEGPALQAADAGTKATAAAGTPAPAAPPEPPELTYIRPRQPVRRVEWLLGGGCIVLALVLSAQVLWAQRANLVGDPATQALALHVCARFDCRLPPIRDTAKLELLSRDVRPLPGVQGALLVTATLRNDAAFRQPWPVVVVELTGLDNTTVAMRRFRPAEYVTDAARRRAGMPPGATAAVAFEVADPGRSAVAFHFSLE